MIPDTSVWSSASIVSLGGRPLRPLSGVPATPFWGVTDLEVLRVEDCLLGVVFLALSSWLSTVVSQTRSSNLSSSSFFLRLFFSLFRSISFSILFSSRSTSFLTKMKNRWMILAASSSVWRITQILQACWIFRDAFRSRVLSTALLTARAASLRCLTSFTAMYRRATD